MKTYALVGNPNCGKSTLFNRICGAHRRTGNYAGVTVDSGAGSFTHKGNAYRVIDLPGAYSLSADTEDERLLADAVNNSADGLIHVMEAPALARALPLTLELLARKRPTVILLNMADELAHRGVKIDTEKLSAMLGVPIFPVSAKTGSGIAKALDALADPPCSAPCPYSAKAICDAVLTEETTPSKSDAADSILLHPAVGFPLLLLLFSALFWLVFGHPGVWLSDRLADGLDNFVVHPIRAWLADRSIQPVLCDYLLNGALGGVCSVLAFLPQIALLFFALAILEDSGILARIAFLCDAPLRKFGLTGRAAIPIAVAFGCSVPAVLSARTADARSRTRLHAALPLISCPARAPVYALLFHTFFPHANLLHLLLLYLFGLFAALFSAKLAAVGAPALPPFAMELPPYRLPIWKNTLYAAWDKCRAFVCKAGTVIFLSASCIWALEHFGRAGYCAEPADSFLYEIGSRLSPLFSPLGFGHPIFVAALLCGVFAKESAVAAIAVLCKGAVDLSALCTPAGAISFLLFFSLYCPCIATLESIRNEAGTKRMLGIAAKNTFVAYLYSAFAFLLFSIIFH